MTAWWKRAWNRPDLTDHLSDALDTDDARVVPLGMYERLERHCTSGIVWPEHDEYDLQCGCRNCHDVDVSLMDDATVMRMFAGLVERERAS